MTDFASAALVRVLGKGMQLLSLDTPAVAALLPVSGKRPRRGVRPHFSVGSSDKFHAS